MTATRIDPNALLPTNEDGSALNQPEFNDLVIDAINDHATQIDSLSGLTANYASSPPVTWTGSLSSNTTTDLAVTPAVGSYAPTTITAIRAGRVVGIQAITETLSAGSCVFAVMINGSTSALALSQTSADAHGTSLTGSASFSAGDTIGVRAITSSTQSPSSGWDVLVWLELTEAVA